MSAIKRIWREHIWDEIKEKHDKYFVTYHPINLKGDKFAELHITFTEPVGVKEKANIMEEEFDIWIKRFPLPLMVISFDEKGNKSSFESVREGDEIIGYVDDTVEEVVKVWERIPNDEFPESQLTDKSINKVYKGLSYKKRNEKEKYRDKKIKEAKQMKRFIDITLFLWFLVSVSIAILGWRNFWVGTMAFVYSVYQTVKRFLKLGKKEDLEYKRKLKYYHYHCERNPEGFTRLVAENIERDEKERIQKEREEI